MIKIIRYGDQTAEELFGKREELTSVIENDVKQIIADVKENGDIALKKYSAKFDGYTGDSFEAEESEFTAAFNSLDASYIDTLKAAIDNIAEFHKKQLRKGFEIKSDGKIIGEKVIPVARVGIYVPGGTAAYPSTVLMNAVPARIAGVGELIMATPVKADGKIKAEVLAAAKLCGVDRVFKIGGAQAIAAMAYGTQTVPKADKITGPGRDYVATAKKLVSGVACGIDMVAGPSEILVVADGNANPTYVAADMLSQAEHDAVASALLVTDSFKLAQAVASELDVQVAKLARREIAETSLLNNGKIIVTENLDIAVRLANEYAPEHLELAVDEPFALLDKIVNAGSVFLGHNTPEAVGDYYAGANHTLPTSGTSRFASPLNVNDFVKTTQYIYYSGKALQDAAGDIISLAMSEGLTGHAESVAVRSGR